MESIAHEEHCDQRDVPGECEAEIGDEEDGKRQEQDVSPAQLIGEKSRWIPGVSSRSTTKGLTSSQIAFRSQH